MFIINNHYSIWSIRLCRYSLGVYKRFGLSFIASSCLLPHKIWRTQYSWYSEWETATPTTISQTFDRYCEWDSLRMKPIDMEFLTVAQYLVNPVDWRNDRRAFQTQLDWVQRTQIESSLTSQRFNHSLYSCSYRSNSTEWCDLADLTHRKTEETSVVQQLDQQSPK